MTMRNRNLTLDAVLAFLLALFVVSPLLADDNEIAWLGDYREALQQAKQTHKPIFLEFRCEA